MSSFFNVSMYFNLILTLSFYMNTQYDGELVERNIREVRQASKSTVGTWCRSLEITRWSVNTLPARDIQL